MSTQTFMCDVIFTIKLNIEKTWPLAAAICDCRLHVYKIFYLRTMVVDNVCTNQFKAELINVAINLLHFHIIMLVSNLCSFKRYII